MKEEWVDMLRGILSEMQDSEDVELDVAIEHLSTCIDEIESTM